MKKIILIAVLAACPVPSFAAEYSHCYIGDAPDDAPVTFDKDLSGLFFSVEAVSIRYACGLNITSDVTMLEQRVIEGGCSPESDAFAFVTDRYAISAEETRTALLGELGGNEEMLNAFCEAASHCVAGETEFDADCQSRVDAVFDQF